MDIVATSLEALIQRICNSNQNLGPDHAAIDAFCAMVNGAGGGPGAGAPPPAQIAVSLLTTRLKSPQQYEALMGLTVLEACMKRCGPHFHAEIGKFRFLNEMIKLVSPKYLGAQTPKAVRQRVLQLMYSWTLEHPKETKIKEAYQMLRKQGVVKDDSIPDIAISGVTNNSGTSLQETIPRANQSSVFKDEKVLTHLQKLLQSKNREDLQAANKLIKTMVKEDERRTEKSVELKSALNNARLLSEVLDSYTPDSSSADDLDLIKELHQSCCRFVDQIARDLKPEENIYGEVFDTLEELRNVYVKYEDVIIRGVPVVANQETDKASSSPPTNAQSLLDLSTPNEENLPPPVDVLSSKVENFNLNSTSTSKAETDLAALGDIFGSALNNCTQVKPFLAAGSSVLQPMPFTSNTVQVAATIENTEEKSSSVKALKELDELGESLLKQSLPSTCRQGIQFNKVANKVPMNQLGRSSSNASGIGAVPSVLPSADSSIRTPNTVLDLDFLTGSTPSMGAPTQDRAVEIRKENDLSNGDDDMVDISEDNVDLTSAGEPKLSNVQSPSENVLGKDDLEIPSSSTKNCSVNNGPSESPTKAVEVKPLSDISISLDSITPGPVPPITALDERNKISVILHPAKDTPRPDVSVFVVSTISKNSSPLFNYIFQAVVPKTCKLRLLPASSSELPAYNPFLPPSAITQVMLIANPSKVNINLKFMISYTMADETITEMGEVDNLPILS